MRPEDGRPRWIGGVCDQNHSIAPYLMMAHPLALTVQVLSAGSDGTFCPARRAGGRAGRRARVAGLAMTWLKGQGKLAPRRPHRAGPANSSGAGRVHSC